MGNNVDIELRQQKFNETITLLWQIHVNFDFQELFSPVSFKKAFINLYASICLLRNKSEDDDVTMTRNVG